MGQQNTKDPRRRRSGLQQGAATNAGGRPQAALMRPSAVNDSVLHTSTVQGSASGSTRHMDPARIGGGSTASLTRNTSGSPTGARAPTNAAATQFPIVLRYQDNDVKRLIESKKQIYVAVEARGWQPIPMTPSTDSFYALLELPAGNHNFRFLIDGSEVLDSTQEVISKTMVNASPVAPQHHPTVDGSALPSGVAATTPVPRPVPPMDGKPANTVYLNDVLLATKEDDDIMDDGTGWGQKQVMFEESRKYPPIVPLHLRYTPLNTPPTLVRCSRDGRMSVMDNAVETNTRMPPEHLPLPLSVTINHVYFQRREDHAVMGITTRYCNKFTTVVYYTHLPSKPVDVVDGVK